MKLEETLTCCEPYTFVARKKIKGRLKFEDMKGIKFKLGLRMRVELSYCTNVEDRYLCKQKKTNNHKLRGEG